MSTGVFFSLSPDELVSRRLEDPLLPAFDCRREAQNRFLHESAWHDQQEWLSTTYLYYVHGILAAYATISASALTLGSRERPRSIRHKATGAIKLLQFGVDRRFQGLGRWHRGSRGRHRIRSGVFAADRLPLPCTRRSTRPRALVCGQGFLINKAEQKQRITAALGKHPIDQIAISMRFDLMDV